MSQSLLLLLLLPLLCLLLLQACCCLLHAKATKLEKFELKCGSEKTRRREAGQSAAPQKEKKG